MSEEKRRLAGILAADVVGYSAMIAADEPATLARVRTLRTEIVEPIAAAHNGRLFKTTGDGFLLEFASAVQALQCAIAIQTKLNAQAGGLRLRIGVHQGEVVPEGGDLFGDSVIIAARLEPLADPGGICISGRVREDAVGKVPLTVEDLGEPELKNIAHKVRVFHVRPAAEARQPLALPDKPSVVVLPFQNMSDDAEQQYFVDGLVEDITTALSRIRSLFVIARNSAFTYKGRAVDVRKVGSELGVRYVLQGSVRKSGNRLRITGQLVAAETGTQLWAERFDGAIDDIFDLQDRITESVAGAIDPQMELAEIERARRKPTRDLGAYDWYLRGLAALHDGTEHSAEPRLREAQAHLKQAVGLDPNFGAAYGMAAFCIFRLKAIGLVPRSSLDNADALSLARLAAQTGRNDARALWGAGATMTYVGQDPGGGILLLERACTLNPNAASAWRAASYARNCLGETEAAVSNAERALRLSPQDPDRAGIINNLAQAHIQAGRYDEAVAWAERGVSDQPTNVQMLRTWVAALALSNRVDEARYGMAEVLRIAPHLRLSRRADFAGPFPAEYRTRMMDAYRIAGMPE